MFERLPTVLHSEELINKAFRRAARAGQRPGKEESVVVTAGNVLSDNLANLVRKFPSMEKLPPFYYELVDVILGVDAIRISLSRVGWASRQIREISREYIGKMRESQQKSALKREAFGRMASIVRSIDQDLLFLNDTRNKLRRLPYVDPDMPAIIVAGYPNVGKSSFLVNVTDARPEIASYPFTTQGISVGHFSRNHRRFQVVDTPGLLDRPLSDRNNIELLALAALRHLKGAVLFILDPTEHSGFPIDVQLRLLSDIKSWLNLPVLVVANKMDLLDFADFELSDTTMSTLTGDGISEVVDQLIDLLEGSLESARGQIG